MSWLQGKKSKDYAADLGYLGSVEIVHRDNIALLSLSQRSRDRLPDTLSESTAQVGTPAVSRCMNGMLWPNTANEAEAEACTGHCQHCHMTGPENVPQGLHG